VGAERLKMYEGSKGKQRAAVDAPGKWSEGETKPKLMIPRRDVDLRYTMPPSLSWPYLFYRKLTIEAM